MLEPLSARFPGVTIEPASWPGAEPTLLVPVADFLRVMQTLRDDPAFRMELLSNETAIDYPPDRIRLVCNLLSISLRQRVCVHVDLPREQPVAPSLVGLWANANFNERELWDLYGIRFTDHPNLKRLLMDEDFVGHPLRKDFTSPHLIPRPET